MNDELNTHLVNVQKRTDEYDTFSILEFRHSPFLKVSSLDGSTEHIYMHRNSIKCYLLHIWHHSCTHIWPHNPEMYILYMYILYMSITLASIFLSLTAKYSPFLTLILFLSSSFIASLHTQGRLTQTIYVGVASFPGSAYLWNTVLHVT